MRKRKGVRAQDRDYKYITREMQADAKKARWRHTLELCLHEIEQFHSKAYPGCDDGCPAHEAMAAARAALTTR